MSELLGKGPQAGCDLVSIGQVVVEEEGVIGGVANDVKVGLTPGPHDELAKPATVLTVDPGRRLATSWTERHLPRDAEASPLKRLGAHGRAEVDQVQLDHVTMLGGARNICSCLPEGASTEPLATTLGPGSDDKVLLTINGCSPL